MTPAAKNPTLTNPYNQILEKRRQQLGQAKRYALAPNCNPITGQPDLSPAQKMSQLISIAYKATVAGDNLLIPTLAGKKLIYEAIIWNASGAAVDIEFYQGPSAAGYLLLPLPNFPATTGFTLGFNGSFEMPHFSVDNGQPFVMNLSTTGPVTGMLRYRVQNGTV